MEWFDKEQLAVAQTATSPDLPETQRDLRYVLTQKCNYQCSFCHKEWCDGSEKELLTADDYAYLYSLIKSQIPIHWVTVTWWEPLLSKDIKNILSSLKERWAFLSMVTNWSLLQNHINEIWFLDRINISLHTFQQEIYETIIWKNVSVDHIINNILTIKNTYPQLDVRINSTLLKTYFDTPSYIDKILSFIKKENITLKYLELSPKSNPLFVPNQSLVPFLEKQWFILQPNTAISKNEKTYSLWWAKVLLRTCACDFAENHGFDQNFCKQYNDIVVSPDGKVSSCILDTKKLDLYQTIKQKNDEAIIKALKEPTLRYFCCLDMDK